MLAKRRPLAITRLACALWSAGSSIGKNTKVRYVTGSHAIIWQTQQDTHRSLGSQVSWQAVATRMEVKLAVVKAGWSSEARIASYTPLMPAWHRPGPTYSSVYPPYTVYVCMYVPFFNNSTASTWTFATPKTAWECPGQCIPHILCIYTYILCTVWLLSIQTSMVLVAVYCQGSYPGSM